MTETNDETTENEEQRPLIGYVRKTGHTTKMPVGRGGEGQHTEVNEFEFLCRGCYEDGDFAEPGGEDDRVATVRDQPAFGKEIETPRCDRCDEILLPDFEEVI